MTPRAWANALLLAGIFWASLIVALWLILAPKVGGVEAWHDSALPASAFVAVHSDPNQVSDRVLARANEAPHGQPQGGAPTPAADRLPYNGSGHRRAVEIATVDGRAAADPDRPAAVPTSSLIGIASWFASPASVSAAGPALRAALGSGWRGTTVTVTGPAGSAVTVLGDWMARDRLIDLDVSVFPRVCGALSLGLCRAEVSW